MILKVLTLFPEMFAPVIQSSILGKAAERGLLQVLLTDIRDYTNDKHNRVDDTPFGGGAGMILAADPIFRSLEAVDAAGRRIIYFSPKGQRLNQSLVEELSEEPELVLLCGHYEGMDQRVLDAWPIEEISVGDYVLTGGELPAMILIDAVARLLPEVLGNETSSLDESISSGLLEYPHYTRPRDYRGASVPDVLLSGNHKEIHLWRFLQSLELTRERRPDLFEAFLKNQEHLTKEERKIVADILKA